MFAGYSEFVENLEEIASDPPLLFILDHMMEGSFAGGKKCMYAIRHDDRFDGAAIVFLTSAPQLSNLGEDDNVHTFSKLQHSEILSFLTNYLAMKGVRSEEKSAQGMWLREHWKFTIATGLAVAGLLVALFG